MKMKLSVLATLALATFSIAGCSSGNAPHGGLVPDISGPATLNAGEVESYSFGASSGMGYRLAYGANWGDGSKPFFMGDKSSDSTASADHAWAQPGTYTITATVTDGHGESGFATYKVQVNPAPPPEP